MVATSRECQGSNDDGNCRATERADGGAASMYDEVWNENPPHSAAPMPRRAEAYDDYGPTELDIPPLSEAYSYYGPTTADGVTDTSATGSDADATLRRLTQLDQTDTLERGMVLYDIARKALVDRSAITGEQTDHDSIMRECNRIMVLNGYPDANLEGKSNIRMGDLPRAWNGVRWDQEFKLYDDAALAKFAGVAADNQASGSGESESQDQEAPEGDDQAYSAENAPEHQDNSEPEPETPDAAPQRDLGDTSSVDAANEFFICQFRDQRWNPQGPASSNDCGPASLAMIAKYYDIEFDDEKYGRIDAGDGNPAHLVSAVRYLMTGGRNEQGLTGLGQIKDAASDLGLNTSHVGSMTDLDNALDAGRLVVLGGNPKDYQEELGLRYGRGGTVYDGGHFITVVGRQGDSYIVNDPANHGGSMVLTRDQVEKYTSYFQPQNRGAAIWADRSHDADPESSLPAQPESQARVSDGQTHMATVDGFQADRHPDLNLDLRGFAPINGLPHYNSDTGPVDPHAPQLAGLFGADHPVNGEHLPAVRQLYRVNDWNWDESIPRSQSKGTRGAPITSTEVTMLGFESTAGEAVYLPNSGYRVDQNGNQGQILYLDRSKGEITIAYNLSGTVAGGYTIHLRGVDFDSSLAEGGLVSSNVPLGHARGSELLVAMADRGTFMDIRHTNHWWHRRNRHGE